MKLADALAQTSKERTVQQPLKVDQIIEALDTEDADQLRAALSSELTHRHIADALTRMGHPIGDSAVARWRRRNVS